MFGKDSSRANSYSQETFGVKITVAPNPLEESSDPTKGIFAFSYTVTIENFSPETLQLIERKWRVYSAEECIAEVEGEGVVGVQPTLNPGERFEYTSGAAIHDPIGSMIGSYTFKNIDGKFVEIPIPEFTLTYPVMIH
jgi:ApaG protein